MAEVSSWSKLTETDDDSFFGVAPRRFEYRNPSHLQFWEECPLEPGLSAGDLRAPARRVSN